MNDLLTLIILGVFCGPISLGAARRSGWSYARDDKLDDFLSYAISIATLALFAFVIFKVGGIYG